MTDLALRPRSATELVDATFQVFRRAPVQFIVAAALVYVPWLVIQLTFRLEITGDRIPGLDVLVANLIATSTSIALRMSPRHFARLAGEFSRCSR
jgi:hypothetical protein